MFRFTPTGVGKTKPRVGCNRDWTVHPHGRGEDDPAASDTFMLDGSPPRAWGRPRAYPLAKLERRFTPTGVGKTLFPCRVHRRGPVHPHGRGEDIARHAASRGLP